MISPVIPQQIRAILPEFLELIKRPIFKQEFERRVVKADGQELAAVANIHRDAVGGYAKIIQSITGGMCVLSIQLLVVCL